MASPRSDTEFAALWDVFNFWAFLVGILTFVLLGYLILRYRAKSGHHPQKDSPFIPGFFPEERDNAKLEFAWFLGPLILVIYLTLITLGPLDRLWPTEADLEERTATEGAPVTVTVVGEKWAWYLNAREETLFTENSPVITDEDMALVRAGYTPNSISIPCDRIVKFHIYSYDVQHAFFIVELGIKEDAVPGLRITLTTKTPKQVDAQSDAFLDGNYTLGVKCAEYCGDMHAYMLATVVITGYDDAGICSGLLN